MDAMPCKKDHCHFLSQFCYYCLIAMKYRKILEFLQISFKITFAGDSDPVAVDTTSSPLSGDFDFDPLQKNHVQHWKELTSIKSLLLFPLFNSPHH